MKNTLVFLSGKQGSGKTTLAQGLITHYSASPRVLSHLKFADPLYMMHGRVLSVLRQYGVETKKKDGRLLQLLGTEWGRSTYGPDLWVQILENRLIDYTKEPLGDRGRFVVVDDARFENELALAMRWRRMHADAWDVLTVRLEAPAGMRAILRRAGVSSPGL